MPMFRAVMHFIHMSSPSTFQLLLLLSLVIQACGGSGDTDQDTTSAPAPKKGAKKSSSGTPSGATATSTHFIPAAEALAPKPLTDFDTIVWSGSRPLRWSDFRSHDFEVNDGANCYVELFADPIKGSNVRWNVLALFFRDRSAATAASRDDARRLAHEQVHFDIAEMHARELRRYLAGQNGSSEAEIRDGFYRKFAEVRLRMESDHRRYDLETHHGSDEAAQAGWTGDITRRLIRSSIP